MITVQKVAEGTYGVTVSSKTITTHRVSVRPTYYLKLTGGRMTIEDLLTRSFEFLLEREDNTSILPSFDLTVITQYFPEYESTIREMF